MDKEEYKRIAKYGKTALDLLKRGNVPPYPKFYDLLFTYSTGSNPTLNLRINDLYERGIIPNTDLVEEIYQEVFRTPGTEERLSAASAKIASSLDEVHSVIGSVQNSADTYTGMLTNASSDLEHAPNEAKLKMLTRTLLMETKKMKETNADLENNLETTRENVSELQDELDRVRRDSMLDPLTRLSNRGAFDLGLASAIEDAEKSNDPLSLLILDIDHFKKFNDTFGHQTGDQVLRLVAKTIQSGVRNSDIAARYGGEEFVVILPITDIPGAIKIAEELRKAVQSRKLLKRSTNEKLGKLTVSIGVATFRSDDTASSIVDRADKCLYAAKQTGRNKVVDETSDLLDQEDGKSASVA